MPKACALFLLALLFLLPALPTRAECNRVTHQKVGNFVCGMESCWVEYYGIKDRAPGSCYEGNCENGIGKAVVTDGLYAGRFRAQKPFGNGVLVNKDMTLTGYFVNGCLKDDVTATFKGSTNTWHGTYDEQFGTSTGMWSMDITTLAGKTVHEEVCRGDLHSHCSQYEIDNAKLRLNTLANANRPSPPPPADDGRPRWNQHYNQQFVLDPTAQNELYYQTGKFKNLQNGRPLSLEETQLLTELYNELVKCFPTKTKAHEQCARALYDFYEYGVLVPKSAEKAQRLFDSMRYGPEYLNFPLTPLPIPTELPHP